MLSRRSVENVFAEATMCWHFPILVNVLSVIFLCRDRHCQLDGGVWWSPDHVQCVGLRRTNGVLQHTSGIIITCITTHIRYYYDDHQIMFSVWDFAGQTVYYNTHQVLLLRVLQHTSGIIMMITRSCSVCGTSLDKRCITTHIRYSH